MDVNAMLGVGVMWGMGVWGNEPRTEGIVQY